MQSAGGSYEHRLPRPTPINCVNADDRIVAVTVQGRGSDRDRDGDDVQRPYPSPLTGQRWRAHRQCERSNHPRMQRGSRRRRQAGEWPWLIHRPSRRQPSGKCDRPARPSLPRGCATIRWRVSWSANRCPELPGRRDGPDQGLQPWKQREVMGPSLPVRHDGFMLVIVSMLCPPREAVR